MLMGGWPPRLRYVIMPSEQTRRPPGPSPPPGTRIRRLANVSSSSLCLRTTWFRPVSNTKTKRERKKKEITIGG